jgi:type II secretion system protein C
MAGIQKSKMTATKISNSVEKRIVEFSLNHPDYGARLLLPLLEQEGITVTTSAVYSILKRNNLQHRTLRLSKLQGKHASAISQAQADTTQEPDLSGEITPPPIKSPLKTRARHPWSLNPLNILLLGLVGYFWVSALGNLLEARREPTLPHDLSPVTVESIPQATVRPLEDYNIIIERNLFGASEEQTPAQQEEVSLEDIPAAENSLGLKLVGTVAAHDSVKRFAIIDNKSTHKQELYREGEKAGEVLIKRILRNKVIVDAGRGEQLLALELEETGNKIEFAQASQPQVDSQLEVTERIHQNIQIDRQQLQSSLGDVEQLIKQAGISPHVQDEQPAGFTITNVEPKSAFAKMGLRSGDSIMSLNGEAITGPEDADKFFQKLREGDDVTIKVKKGKGLRRRTRVMRLYVE